MLRIQSYRIYCCVMRLLLTTLTLVVFATVAFNLTSVQVRFENRGTGLFIQSKIPLETLEGVDGLPSQIFIIEEAESAGVHKIRLMERPTRVWDLQFGWQADGTPITDMEDQSNDDRRFRIYDAGEGYYRIFTVKWNKTVDGIKGGDQYNPHVIQNSFDPDSMTQQWRIISVNDAMSETTQKPDPLQSTESNQNPEPTTAPSGECVNFQLLSGKKIKEAVKTFGPFEISADKCVKKCIRTPGCGSFSVNGTEGGHCLLAYGSEEINFTPLEQHIGYKRI